MQMILKLQNPASPQVSLGTHFLFPEEGLQDTPLLQEVEGKGGKREEIEELQRSQKSERLPPPRRAVAYVLTVSTGLFTTGLVLEVINRAGGKCVQIVHY